LNVLGVPLEFGVWILNNRSEIFVFCCHIDGKTFKKPRHPNEKERLDAELKLVGEY